jgi:outer membrane protein assembly factor BamB
MRTKLNNVVLRDHYIYGLDDVNLACQDVANGNILWRRPDHDGYGQILQAGDLLLVQNEAGNVSLIDARHDGFTELGRLSAVNGSNTCWNPLALAGHLLLVRSEREAACFRLP